MLKWQNKNVTLSACGPASPPREGLLNPHLLKAGTDRRAGRHVPSLAAGFDPAWGTGTGALSVLRLAEL